jgi:hypothetical protein
LVKGEWSVAMNNWDTRGAELGGIEWSSNTDKFGSVSGLVTEEESPLGVVL